MLLEQFVIACVIACVIVVKTIVVVSIIYYNIWIVKDTINVVDCCMENWKIKRCNKVLVLIDRIGFVRGRSSKGKLIFSSSFSDDIGYINSYRN